ncbi:MAG: ABC transporter ATP-binding protein [Oscillospiraceae bacterium]|jgi:ABC-2 type transport system ATP-binding protein
MEYVLECKDVTKYYDGFTLDHVNFALPSGCIMGFIGENGAGKSTTIKLILDLIRRDGGEITVLGESTPKGTLSVKEDIGVVLDECCFPEILTVKNVNAIMRGIYKNWDEPFFFQKVQEFSLPTKKRLKDFSKGMKMKLTIACVLSHHSRLLIMDEPTSGLDPVVRDEILESFLEFIQDEEHSILLSSHIISDLEKICDYITLIHKGKILLCEQKDTLLERYGVLKGSAEELKSMDSAAVIGTRTNQFGAEALVLRDKVNGNHVIDPATIEDIMLFHIKGDAQ